ncbi:hypothetical protein BKA82DRAFT_2526475 [Pisolithus tinctorius]|nr:hypothetical protein BKA82DRAFT_2526475 [Pisolithus tinctorius]
MVRRRLLHKAVLSHIPTSRGSYYMIRSVDLPMPLAFNPQASVTHSSISLKMIVLTNKQRSILRFLLRLTRGTVLFSHGYFIGVIGTVITCMCIGWDIHKVNLGHNITAHCWQVWHLLGLYLVCFWAYCF